MKDMAFDCLSTSEMAHILVVPVPGFSMLALGSIVELLSFAATNFPRYAPNIRVATPGTTQSMSASGVEITCTNTITSYCDKFERGLRPGAVFICCGERVDDSHRKPLLRLLRACNRQSVRVFTIGAATNLLVQSGLIREGTATTHWKALAALAEAHRDIGFEEALFLKNGNHTTCAGEASALDMIVDFIREHLPQKVAQAVCAQFLISFPRQGSERQPGSALSAAGCLPATLKALVEGMCAHLETPKKLGELCRTAAVSQRQVERLFNRHLGVSPSQYYRRIRLDRARQLVEQTNLALQEVAIACGFHSLAGFSKRYQERFGLTPHAARRLVTNAAWVM